MGDRLLVWCKGGLGFMQLMPFEKGIEGEVVAISFHFTEKKEEGVKKKTDIAALLHAFA
jgi:hypothetical protein